MMTTSSHVCVPPNLRDSDVNSLTGKEPINYEDFMGSPDSLTDHIKSVKQILKDKAEEFFYDEGMRQVLSDGMYDLNHIAEMQDSSQGKKGLLKKLFDTLLEYLERELSSIFVQMQQEYFSPNNHTSLRRLNDVLEPRFKSVSKMIADVRRHRLELELELNMMHRENFTMLENGTAGASSSQYTRTRELQLVATGDSSNTLQQKQDHSAKNETKNIIIIIPVDVVNDPHFTTALKMVNDVAETHLLGDMGMAKIMIATVIGLLAVYCQGNSTMSDDHPNMAMEFVIGAFASAFAFSFVGMVLRRSSPRIAKVCAPLGTGLTVFGLFFMVARMLPPKFMWLPVFLGFLSLGSLVLNIFKMECRRKKSSKESGASSS